MSIPPQDLATPKDIRYRQALKKLTKFLEKWVYLIIACCSVITLISLDINYWNYTYTDADGYMRAIRLYHWLTNPDFWEQRITESNYPFGEINHWTRPMDILWLINIVPYLHQNICNLKDLIFLGGVFLSPWLFIISCIALIYGLKRQFSIYLAIFGALIYISDPTLQYYFAIGRPDHHSLMLLFGIYSLSLNLCWLKKRQNRYLRLLGITLALSTYTAIEGFILYILFLGFQISLYIFKNISLKSCAKTAKYFALSLGLLWAINPPYEGWFYVDNGRLSILYVTTSFLIWIALYILEKPHLHTKGIKICSLFFAAISIFFILLLIYGKEIYNFPLDTEIQTVWSKRISEMRPIWKQSWDLNLAIFSFSGLSLLVNIYLIRNKKYQRILLLNLCLSLPLYALNILAQRFSNYQMLYSILPWLCLIDSIYIKSDFHKRKTIEFPMYIAGICLCIAIFQQFIYLPYKINQLLKPQGAHTYHTQLCQNIKNIGGTIVTDSFLGPQYIWECDVNSVGTPYHRNREGLVDNHKILYGTKDSEIIPLLLKHQVTQILLFDKYDRKYYDMSEKNKNKLYYRLIKRENIPPYLEEIPDKYENTRHYRLKL